MRVGQSAFDKFSNDSVVRVLHIVGRMDRAGAETMIMNLYREVDRTRYQFDFVYFTDERCDYDDEIKVLGGNIVRLKASNPVSRFVSLWRVLRKGKWSIVQSHTLFSIGLNLLAAKLAGVPHRIAHSHSTSDANSSSVIGRLYQSVMRWLLAWVPTNYVACGSAASDYLFPGKHGVEIIPNAIDIPRFSEANGEITRRTLGIPEESLTILHIGRLMPVKNHQWSLKVAAALQEAGADFQMLFVGNGPEREAIEDQIEMLGLKRHVRLLGLRQDIPELMAVADVMLMPSLHEGFPVVLVESQAAGLPAVISSEISPEVDLGLGIIDFVALDEAANVWAERIIRSAYLPHITIDKRRPVLEKYGFSSAAGARKMTKIYSPN